MRLLQETVDVAFDEANEAVLSTQRLGLLSQQHFWPPWPPAANDHEWKLKLEIPSKGDGKQLTA